MAATWPVVAGAMTTALLVTGCGGGPDLNPAALQPPQPAVHQAAPVALGDVQDVAVSSSFGPNRAPVPVTISVLRFRDRVRASDHAVPSAVASHWASAEVQVCRSAPVALGYPAWVLGDDAGRTAQVAKVLHPGWPTPVFPNASQAAGCARGWVTWVTPDALHPTKVSFEQTRRVPGVWRLG